MTPKQRRAFDREANDGKKTCNRCGERKPTDRFTPQPNGFMRRRTQCIACHARATKVWRSQNRIRYNAQARRYYHANPAAAAEIHRRWSKSHPERVAERNAKRRGATSVARIPRGAWAESKASYAGLCVYCGKRPDRLTQDHIEPLVRGGAHAIDNIVPACRSCNSAKRDRPLLVFLALRAA